jgi:hypothetical protein
LTEEAKGIINYFDQKYGSNRQATAEAQAELEEFKKYVRMKYSANKPETQIEESERKTRQTSNEIDLSAARLKRENRPKPNERNFPPC